MRKYLLSFCISVLWHPVFAQDMNPSEIDTLINRTMRTFDVPGISAGIVKDGKVVYAKGFGVNSLSEKQKVDEKTRFGIASNSKAFTAATIGILVDEGKINWDDPVRKYIPEFKLYDPYVSENFTIRDLLTHRSGLGLGAGDLMLFPDSNNFTLPDIIHNLQFLKPVSGFRTKFDYDNNLYVVAGELVARVSGMSWDEFVESRILKPLHMDHSAACYERLADKSNVAAPHAPVNGKLEVVARDNFKLGHSAGGMICSIEDMNKWMMAQLNHGISAGDSQRIFSKKAQEEMWSPQTILPVRGPGPYNTHFSAYGMGFFLSDVKGYKQVAHTGGLAGMVTQVTLIPELNLGIVVLTNQEAGSAFSAITNQLKDHYLGLTGTDRVKEYGEALKHRQENAGKIVDSVWHISDDAYRKKSTAAFAPYAGTYEDPWFGKVTISEKNGKLYFLSARAYKIQGEMYYFRGNTFLVKWQDRSMNADAFVSFCLDDEGHGNAFTMKTISPATDFSFDFQDLDFKRSAKP